MSSCCIHLLRVWGVGRTSVLLYQTKFAVRRKANRPTGRTEAHEDRPTSGRTEAHEDRPISGRTEAHEDRPTSGRTEADEGQYSSHMPVLLCGMDFLTVCAILCQD